jgi:hypothetical protein
VEEAQMKKKIELDFEAPTKIRGFFLFLHMLCGMEDDDPSKKKLGLGFRLGLGFSLVM